MIYLLTGTPGHGKTQRALWLLLNDSRFKGRDVYVANVRGLKIDDPRLSNFTALSDVTKWKELPPGSIVFIDEAHKREFFPLRPSMQPPPKWIEDIAEHRHSGIDFVLVTQHPKKIDVEVRRLVELHIHCKRPAQLPFTNLYEFQGVVDVDGKVPTSDALRHERWRFDKSIWSLYDSADEHTVKARLPRILFAIPVLLAAFVGAVGYTVHKFSPKSEAASAAKAVPVKAGSPTLGAGADAVPKEASDALSRMAAAARERREMFDARVPRHVNYPESAPMYDDVREVKAFQRLSGCVQKKHVCKCYDQQGILLKLVEETTCRDYVLVGRFDPYRDEEKFADRERQRQGEPPTQQNDQQRPSEHPPYLVQGLSGHWFTETRQSGYSVSAGGDFVRQSQSTQADASTFKQGGAGGTPAIGAAKQ
jgi:zona occludens toxin